MAARNPTGHFFSCGVLLASPGGLPSEKVENARFFAEGFWSHFGHDETPGYFVLSKKISCNK